MTENVRPDDRALARWLDHDVPPPLSDGFAARVLAARHATATRQTMPRRNRRARWLRRSLITGLTIGVMSAAAAATMMFGPVSPRTPIIGALVAQVQTLVRPVPRRVAAPKAVAKPAMILAPVAPMRVAAPHGLQAERRVARIERRIAWRARAGLPPRAHQRQRLRAALRNLPPAVREARMARREARFRARLARWRARDRFERGRD